MANYYCEYCGFKTTSMSYIAGGQCQRHPDGACKGKHKLYEGNEKSQYICKFCGMKFSSIANLTGGMCQRHPKGACKGRHSPAL